MVPWGLLGAEALCCLLLPPPRMQPWARARSQCPQQPGQTSLHGVTPVLVVTLWDPAWGACGLCLFAKSGHPTSRNKDGQGEQEH